MNTGSLTTVQLVGVWGKHTNKRIYVYLVTMFVFTIQFRFFPLFVYLVSVGKGKVGCQFGAIYHREPVAITNMCFFSGQKTCTQIQIMHFETNHKMQMLDCYSLLSDRENALKWNKKINRFTIPNINSWKLKGKKSRQSFLLTQSFDIIFWNS